MKAVKYALLGLIGVIGLLVSTFSPFKVPFAETLTKAYYRYAIAGMLIVLFLFGGLIALLVNLFDPNQFKVQIVRWVQERTQRELALEGELKLSYFPKLGLETGKATLSQRRSAREFAALDRARVTIAWLPLLRRQVLIDSAEVDGLRAQLVRFKDGSTNVDDLLRDLATVSTASIDVDHLRLSRSTLQWNDEIDWQRGSLNDLQIEIGRLSDGRAGPLDASVRIDAPQAGIDARLQLKSRLLFDAVAGRLELTGLDAQLEGRAFGVDNLALGLKGEVSALPKQRSVSLENIVATAATKSGLSLFNARLATPELKVIDRRVSGAQLSIDTSIAHPDQTTTAALQVPRFEWADNALRGATANAQWSARGPGAHLRAQLTSPLLLHLDDGPRLELGAVEVSANAHHPALATEVAGQGTGRLEIDLKHRSARLVLAGKLAGSEMRGELSLADFIRPRWDVAMQAASLDLDALLSPAWLARWGDDATPFDASALRDTTLQGTLRVEQIKLFGLQANALAARFEAQRTELLVQPLSAKAYGATLDASVRVAAGAVAQVTTTGTLSDLDTRGLLADLMRKPWLEGRATLGWDLRTQGGSVGSLRAALVGPVNLAVQGGALAGVDLRAALLEGRPELGKRSVAQARDFNPGNNTPFQDMKARFELHEGRAHAQTLELNTAGVHAAGEGEFLLEPGVLDLRLRATVGRGGPELAGLAGVSVPLQVHGPWRRPRFAFDFGAASGPGLPRAPDPPAESPVALMTSIEALSSVQRTPAALTDR